MTMMIVIKSLPTNKGGIEEIVEVTRAVGNKSAKVANINPDPLTYTEAMSHPDRAQWRAVCAEEIKQFVCQNIFNMVSKPEGHKVVDCKWVFKIKLDPNDQVKQYKAHLVAKRFSQVEDIDFNETYSPVVGHSMALSRHHENGTPRYTRSWLGWSTRPQ